MRFNILQSWPPVCWIMLNSSKQQRKAVVQRREGVNDLWSAPAADVWGMEVNRDEVFSMEPQLTWQTSLMLPSVLGHFFSSYNRTGSLPFLNLTLLGLTCQQLLTIYSAFSMPWPARTKSKLYEIRLLAEFAGLTLHVSCSYLGYILCKCLIIQGVLGLSCSYPTGVEKGISEPSLSLFNPPVLPHC